MGSFIGLEKNISYFTIPVAFFLALYPRSLSMNGPGQKYFDPSNPRKFGEQIEKSDLDKKIVQRLQRAEACSSNGFENLPLFAAALVAGNSAGLSADLMNMLSVGYVLSRAAYNWIYIWGQENRRLLPARTLVWFAGVAAMMTMFVSAGLQA